MSVILLKYSFDEVDAFYTCGHDAIMNDAYGDELPIVPRVWHEIVGHEQHDLCDSYILDVVHDATGNYFERGKFGCRNFHVTKTPLSLLKVLKLFFFYLPMLVTLCFHDLFLLRFLGIGSGLGLNIFHICFLMLSFASTLILL